MVRPHVAGWTPQETQQSQRKARTVLEKRAGEEMAKGGQRSVGQDTGDQRGGPGSVLPLTAV